MRRGPQTAENMLIADRLAVLVVINIPIRLLLLLFNVYDNTTMSMR